MTRQELTTIRVYKSVYNCLDNAFPFITVIYSDAKSASDDEDVIIRAKLFWDSKNGLWRIYSVSALGDGRPVIQDFTRRVQAVTAWESLIKRLDNEFDAVSAGLYV